MVSNRREFVKSSVVAGSVALAGCIGSGSNADVTWAAGASGLSGLQTAAIEDIGAEEVGLDVEFTLGSAEEIGQLVINESADVGSSNPTGMAQGWVEGNEIRVFGPSLLNVTALLTLPDSGIESFEDLENGSIATLSPPSGNFFHTATYLKERFDWDLDEDIEHAEGSPAIVQEQILSGGVDAGMLFYPYFLEDYLEGNVEIVEYMPDTIEQEFGFVPEFTNLIAYDEWIDENPDKASRVQEASIIANEYISDNPSEMLDMYADEVGITDDEVIDIMEEVLPDFFGGWDTDEAKDRISFQVERAKELDLVDEGANEDIVREI